MVVLLLGNLLEKLSDVGVRRFNTPELSWQTLGRAIFFVERRRQRLPIVFIRQVPLSHVRSAPPRATIFSPMRSAC